MSISQHLSNWQGLFTATVSEKINELAILLLLAVAFSAFFVLRRRIAFLLNAYASRWKVFMRHNSLLVIFNPLREALSQGILNPKPY